MPLLTGKEMGWHDVPWGKRLIIIPIVIFFLPVLLLVLVLILAAEAFVRLANLYLRFRRR